MKYPVNEAFQTIQGEGVHAGTPAVFVRLQGCAVGCPWCDTKHTWKLDHERVITLEDMLDKVADDDYYAEVDAAGVLAIVRGFDARHVVITGGEPCDYDLEPLTRTLADAGYLVQIETSGTAPVRVDPRAFVTVSPKLDMPGGLAVRDDALMRADEIKHPVGKRDDVRKLRERVLSKITPRPIVWLQPLSQSRSATSVCVEQATEHGLRVSIQTHKYIGVR